MSKALKWLEAESDRLEKECNENNDPHKTVNHSFLEGFNYALLNAQALEQIQLDDNQKIVLEWLKWSVKDQRHSTIDAVFLLKSGEALDSVLLTLMELNDPQQAEVLAAFAQWALEQEEE